MKKFFINIIVFNEFYINSLKKLIKNLKKGKESAFKEVYFTYYDKLYNVAKRFNFKFLTPDDFVQESFLKLYNKRALLKEDVVFEKQPKNKKGSVKFSCCL